MRLSGDRGTNTRSAAVYIRAPLSVQAKA